jgi:hypothetical protein
MDLTFEVYVHKMPPLTATRVDPFTSEIALKSGGISRFEFRLHL